MKNAKRNAKRIVLGSIVASMLLTQVNALEVYKDEEKKTSIDVYGSIRGYVGEGTYLGDSEVPNSGSSKLIFGMQTSSRLGVTGKIGKVTAQIELGGATGEYVRQLWGSYNFGDAGKILLGKTDTPSLAKGFSSDIFDNDNGATGFGSVRTSNRKIQLQYSIKGFQLALVDDSGGNNIVSAYNHQNRFGLIPRIAVSYSGKGDIVEYKGATTIKIIQGGDATTGDIARYRGRWGAAGHVLGGVKVHLLDKKLFISAQLHVGIDGDIYGEQRINRNIGGYNFAHDQLDWTYAYNVLMGGELVEVGFKAGPGTLIAAVGYQFATPLGTPSNYNISIHGLSGMVQYPMKFGKFTLTPQVSYYSTTLAANNVAAATFGEGTQSGLMAFVQGRFDF